MAGQATWTYQVPGADASGLEDYLVETGDGRPAGKIVALLERDGERYLAFDAGVPPLARERRAVRWEDVDAVDHDTLPVRLRLAEPQLAGALEPDPAGAVEDGEADALRVTQLPRELTPAAAPGTRGPVDRASYAGAVGLFAGGLIALLALFVAAAATEFTWEFALFAVPAVLVAAAAIIGYRTFRQPNRRVELNRLFRRMQRFGDG
jgi:hypothetical protein